MRLSCWPVNPYLYAFRRLRCKNCQFCATRAAHMLLPPLQRAMSDGVNARGAGLETRESQWRSGTRKAAVLAATMRIPPALEFFPPLLEGLPGPESSAILAQAAFREFPARSVLCRQGEAATAMFLVRAGRVRFARATHDGRDVLLRMLGPGQCFGIASLAPGHLTYMATALTLDAAKVYSWEAETIRSAAFTHPRVAQNALNIALRYLEEFTERHAALLTRTAEQRVARTITHLGATCGRVLPTGVEVDITNQSLASLSDVGMFTVSRLLKRWEREGHVLKQRQRVVLRHPEALLFD